MRCWRGMVGSFPGLTLGVRCEPAATLHNRNRRLEVRPPVPSVAEKKTQLPRCRQQTGPEGHRRAVGYFALRSLRCAHRGLPHYICLKV